jgi:hypothetical protein
VRLDLAWEKPGRTLGRQFGRKADGDFSPSSKAGLAAFDLFLADLADWVDPRRRVGFVAWVAAPAAMRASMVNHSRFSGCEPCSGRGFGPTTGPSGRASVDGKVYLTVDVSYLLKITSALLKARSQSGRYHGCRKPSTHVSLRHKHRATATGSD